MRVLVVHPGSDFSVDDVHRGYVKGLRAAGCDVAEYNLNDRLAFYANVLYQGEKLEFEQIVERAALGLHSKLYEWWPDLLIVMSGFYIMPITWQLLKYRNHKTAVVFTESPYEDDRQMNLVEEAEPDVVIVNDPANLHVYRQANKHVEYLPHCYDPDVHYPGHTRDVDFSFVGTGYPSRIGLFESVDWSGIDAKFAGHWKGLADDSPLLPFLLTDRKECYDNGDTADLYRRSRMSANFYRGKDTIERTVPSAPTAIGPREVELAACETFFLRDSGVEGDRTFWMLPTFTDADDFSSQLRWWLARPDERRDAIQAAHAAIADRTFDRNARRLLELVDQT